MLIEKTPLLTPSEAANYLNIKVETLSTWRCTKRYSIPYKKVGRLIRYNKADLDNWLTSREVSNVQL